MKRVLKLLILLLVLSSCSPALSPAATPEPPVTPETSSISVLFLGNSYTYGNDLPETFAELARSGGHEVEVGMVAEGGWSLADHLESAETLARLKSRQWTYVVLQEQSQIPALGGYRGQVMYPAARELVSKIRAIGATPIFFLTWAHRGGWPEYSMDDYESMQRKIEEGYMAIAQELNVPVAPVGSAWRTVVLQYPDVNLWREDGSHPTMQGTYLAACVFYAVIFEESPLRLDYRADISTETASRLQSIGANSILDKP